MISDHLLPWVRSQAHAGHVWTTIGAIAQAADALEVGTGVTAMIHRVPSDHRRPRGGDGGRASRGPVLPGRRHWGTAQRAALRTSAGHAPASGGSACGEAIDVIRQVWRGGTSTSTASTGGWRTCACSSARPARRRSTSPSSGKRSARMAGECGDGIIAVTPDARLVDAYHGAGGDGPCIGQLHVSLAATMDAAVDNAWEQLAQRRRAAGRCSPSWPGPSTSRRSPKPPGATRSSADRRVRHGRRSRSSKPSTASSAPATARSTSIRSDLISAGSPTSPPASCCRTTAGHNEPHRAPAPAGLASPARRKARGRRSSARTARSTGGAPTASTPSRCSGRCSTPEVDGPAGAAPPRRRGTPARPVRPPAPPCGSTAIVSSCGTA